MTHASLALPGNRDENWRYAALRAVNKTDWAQTPARADGDVLTRILERLPPAMPQTLRLVVYAGRLLTELSDCETGRLTHPAIDVRTLPAAAASVAAASLQSTDIDRRLADINRCHAPEVLTLTIGRTSAPSRIEIICCHDGVSQPAIEIQLLDDAQAEIIERHQGLGDAPATTNLRLGIRLGRRARLDHARLLQPTHQTHHLETLELALDERAVLHCTSVTLAGASSRSTVLIEHGPYGEIQWQAATLAEGQQVHDAYVRTVHAATGAITRQLFRGIASDRSRIAFNGHMRVTSEGARSDLQQSLKCLLDGEAAEANLRPQLEIHIDAITASHGATVGKLDRDMLFYLLSRGLDTGTAESLLKWAFISDVLTKLSSATLRRQIESVLLSRLPGAIAAHASDTLCTETTVP